MCQKADMYELRDRPQKRTVEKSRTENLLKEECTSATEKASRKKDFFEKCSTIREIETIPAKITILHSKNESIILRAEEDPRKPWSNNHFTEVASLPIFPTHVYSVLVLSIS